MIAKVFYKLNSVGKKLYRSYSTITPTIKQLPTNVVYDCWVYKLDENGNETNDVDWGKCGVIDVENAPYTYIETDEVIEDETN